MPGSLLRAPRPSPPPRCPLSEGRVWSNPHRTPFLHIIFRFDAEGRTVGTLGTNPEPWTWLTHVIERAAPGRAALYQETDIGWSRDGSMFVADGYGNSRVGDVFGRTGGMPGTFDSIHQLACPDEKTLYLADLYASRLDKWVAQ